MTEHQSVQRFPRIIVDPLGIGRGRLAVARRVGDAKRAVGLLWPADVLTELQRRGVTIK